MLRCNFFKVVALIFETRPFLWVRVFGKTARTAEPFGETRLPVNGHGGQSKQWSCPAYRALNLSEHRIIARIRIELAHHGGRDNGKLPVTFQNFRQYGVRWESIAPSIRAAEALGFIRVTRYGQASTGEFRIATLFALTHLPTNDDQVAATDDWRKIETIEEAMAVAETARKAPARGRRFPKRKAAPSGLMGWTTPTLTEIAYTDELRRLYRCEAVAA